MGSDAKDKTSKMTDVDSVQTSYKISLTYTASKAPKTMVAAPFQTEMFCPSLKPSVQNIISTNCVADPCKLRNGKQ